MLPTMVTTGASSMKMKSMASQQDLLDFDSRDKAWVMLAATLQVHQALLQGRHIFVPTRLTTEMRGEPSQLVVSLRSLLQHQCLYNSTRDPIRPKALAAPTIPHSLMDHMDNPCIRDK